MLIEKMVYETLDTGVYHATVREITITEGKYGPQLQWDFDLVEGGSQRGWTGVNMSPKAKLTKWVLAIIGQVPDAIETNTLIGKPCRLSLVIDTKEDGSEFNKLDAVLAPRVATKAKARPQPEAPPPTLHELAEDKTLTPNEDDEGETPF
jgi:hypothetical protein